jgi:MarR family transcriptional regulator, organic hydroperoxide resistance regulator
VKAHGDPGIVPALQAATHHLLEHVSSQLADLGLTAAEINLLAQFGAPAGSPDPRGADRSRAVSQLVIGTGQRPSTVTGILDRLERRGLTERQINPRDRRSFTVSLTDPGAAAAARVAAVVAGVERELESATSERARSGFRAVAAAVKGLHAS